MSHQLFDELIGTPPPPRVDARGIVRRERRARAGRRLGGSLAAVLALALAGGVNAAVGDREPGAAPQAVASSPTADTRFRLVFDTEETADATGKRLSQELDRALREVAPGAKWTWMPEYLGEPRKPDGQPPRFVNNGTSDLVNGTSGVSYQGRKGALGVSIAPDRSGPDGTGPCAQEGDRFRPQCVEVGFHWPCPLPPDIQEDNRYRRECTEGTTPSGARTKTETYTGRRQQSVQHVVSVQLPDNRVFEVSAVNMVGVDESAVPAQPESPLSREQVTAIARYLEGRVKA
ncbi:hypothetical protein [Micromonospora sp. NBC_01638]|uniref:hypothetical protein n=1 Tax=Micromonospora sp. NBC_01638 TaxID=2975982 RepID=UPI00386BB3E1|nr:hypothetical protein OG811_10030 [Micromonospora sp. NBC_01638]